MQVRFAFSSDPIRDPAACRELASAFETRWREKAIDETRSVVSDPVVEVTDEHVVVIRIEITIRDSDHLSDSFSLAAASAELFAGLSSRFGVDWVVGHQFEPRLGSIQASRPIEAVIGEMKNTILVARSLAGMIVDDEFVEPSEIEADSILDACDDASSWDQIFQLEEPFIRFPKLD